ncbi:Sua5/YciO/YrdC/YwlC family protein [Ferrimicrobium sp.]|uniref:Sua5/YciO/YrdC/YwlC family protein n=1 Tax=Ferrimicrobium sp. TaxID=2926050 RepID=UPI003450FB6D
MDKVALDALARPGSLIVSATKVGYILMAIDGIGLGRKFDAKQRNRNKPAVVLCASLEELEELAVLNNEIRAFYRMHWESGLLLGCILPWRTQAQTRIPDSTTRELVMDGRGTSCFVVRFGRPAEQLVAALWDKGRLVFASSANPSGIGNEGRVDGIGERIAQAADCIVEADEYVSSIQPGKDQSQRHEQGVMVSMVDDEGKLIPEQHGQRSVTPCPVLIRRGLDYEQIMENLAVTFQSWDYRHGQYY